MGSGVLRLKEQGCVEGKEEERRGGKGRREDRKRGGEDIRGD